VLSALNAEVKLPLLLLLRLVRFDHLEDVDHERGIRVEAPQASVWLLSERRSSRR